MQGDDIRIKQLIDEMKTATSDEAIVIATELAQIATEAVNAAQEAEDLANAVLAFADWQRTGYKSGEAAPAVAKALWHEVSDRVYAITGTTPANPTAGPKNSVQ